MKKKRRKKRWLSDFSNSERSTVTFIVDPLNSQGSLFPEGGRESDA